MSRRSILLAVLALPPALFAVPVLRGIASTLHALLSTSQPYFADVAGPSTDGLDLHLGGPLYGDPDHEYPSSNYTPLLSLLVAGLDTAHEWTGWALLATILASLGMIGLAAVLAWRRADGPLLVQAAVALGALGMGALAWWLVAFVPLNFLYTGRPDQLSWAFAFAGLVLVPAAARGSARALVASALLLSLAFWTKQTAIAAPAAAVLWLALQVVRGRAAPATALRFAGGLLVLNAVVLGALQLATKGGAWFYIVEVTAGRGSIGYGEALERMARPCAAAGLLAVVLWVPVIADRRRESDWRLPVAGVLALFLVLEVPLAAVFRQGRAATDNHFDGVAWALGLLAAAGWGATRAEVRRAAVAAAAVLALFVLSSLRSLRDSLAERQVYVPAKTLRAPVGDEPFGLRALARERALYHPVFSYLAAERLGRPYGSVSNLQTVVSAGQRPGQLLDGLLDRRLDVVFAFQDRGPDPAWGAGRHEDDFAWKLNETIRAKYRPAAPSPVLEGARSVRVEYGFYTSPGAFERRPGPDPAPWLSRCFGPFEIAGHRWTIGSGGGFWCRTVAGGSVLRLVRTRAERSELRTEDYRALDRGRIVVTARRAGVVTVSLGGWRARRGLAPGRRTSIALPGGKSGTLSVTATRASAADVDLGGA